MDQQDIQKKIEGFLKELGVPGFIIFGVQKEDDKKNYHVISSFHEMPINAAIKGISHVLNEFVQKSI